MKSIKITREDYEKRLENDEPVLRSCWKCNSAHKYLKKSDYLILCFECGRLYLKGNVVIGILGDKE